MSLWIRIPGRLKQLDRPLEPPHRLVRSELLERPLARLPAKGLSPLKIGRIGGDPVARELLNTGTNVAGAEILESVCDATMDPRSTPSEMPCTAVMERW